MRFVTVLTVLVALGFASVFALATFVSPRTREMTVDIPSQRLKAQPVAAAAQPPAKTAGAEAGAGGASTTR
ncbi:hypothetical protein IHQ68_19420 [Chelatococcus sambhunathii]|uniref:Uncharacterized protein n=1 Tax=Chelatococcus sambhunathii TaxID=363953 RepID=A0ABU1DKX2_9HYPH|nr:hypothetical protein [Chelatococcus sambhunathii]MDR4308797.1 hypothetical protein [Chelatococcus sambhunathii]